MYRCYVRLKTRGEEEKMEKVNFFSADFLDGNVHLAGKVYPAGSFAVHLLNQYYDDDTALRIGVFTINIWAIQDILRDGYINIWDYMKIGEDLLHIFDALPRIKPFDVLDVSAEKARAGKLFSKENGEQILSYFQRRAKVGMMDEGQRLCHVQPHEYDKEFFRDTEKLLEDVLWTLNFYDQLSTGMQKVFHKLQDFVDRADDADRLDESHLLPIAMSVFGKEILPIKTLYLPHRKTKKSKILYVTRRMYFDDYFSFILADFFEGLHYGHYPRQCEICDKYFLMTSARRQKYCSGYAPFLIKGKRIPCRKYGARINRKEYAEDNPLIAIYKNRCSAIRVEKSRGTITEEFASAARALAKEHKQQALHNNAYAARQYGTDMSREKLYADTDKKLNHKER